MKQKFKTKWQYWIEERYHKLQDQINQLHQEDHTEQVITHQKLKFIRIALLELRQHAVNTGFDSRAEEIWFLKTLLPKYRSLHFLYGEWLEVLMYLPTGSPRLVTQHYLGHLKKADRFFQQHYPFYPYYQLGMSESDELYFVRGVNSDSTLHLSLADPAYSTEVSELFARFKAMEQLRIWLLAKIKELGGYPIMDTWQEPFMGRRLKWTGTKVNLAELIYGLYFTGQLNNGQATLTDIATLMEDLFQLKIGLIHRCWPDIRIRKKLTATNFLDQMRQSIMNVIDQDMAYDPSKKKHV